MAEEQKNQKPASFIITLEDYIEEQQKEPGIADRLGSNEMQALMGRIAAGFGVLAALFSYAAEFVVMKKDWAVYLPEILEQNLNLDPIVARAIAAETAAKVFPKFGARFDAPKKYEDLWKINKLSPILLTEAIDSILNKANVGPSSGKLSEILATRFNEVRDERGMMKTILAKKENGGLGIKEKDAEIITRLAALYSGNIVRPKASRTAPLPIPVNGAQNSKPAEAPRPAPVAAKSSKEITIGASDAEEARQISERKAIKIVPGKTGEEYFKEKIRQIILAANLNFPDTFLVKRFETILSARFRDVRDEVETKEMLMRGEKVGGLGLSAVQTDKVLELLKGVFAEVSVIYKKDEEEKKNKFVREQVEKEALRRSDRERREREEREKLYVRVTSVAPTIKQLKVKSQELEVKRTPTLQISNSQLSTSTSHLSTLNSQLPATRPRVEEVKFTPKVVGPVEELRMMGVAEFHRLSKDPKMAVQKIKDKLELLADEDYSKKISGIKAWQESGVNRLYLNILRDGLIKGTAISVAIDEAAKAGGDIITKDEFTAIMELNRDLRF